MTPTGLDEDRVVQIVASGTAVGEEPRLGSGYLAGGGLAVTAAHVVHGLDAVTVRRVLRRGEDAQIVARVVWIDSDPGTDLAILRLAADPQDTAAFPADLPLLRFGRVDGRVECETLGFGCGSSSVSW